jgi:hypothetical protein
MNTKLPRDLIEKLMPALRELAEIVANNLALDNGRIQKLLFGCSIKEETDVINELEYWCQLLSQVRVLVDNAETKGSILISLQERGIPEAPAVLAIEIAAGQSVAYEPDNIVSLREKGIPKAPSVRANKIAAGQPLACDPDSIDFGSLKTGEVANKTLTVNKILSNVTALNRKITCYYTNFADGSRALVRVTISAGREGEKLQDFIILQSQSEELRISVKAEWRKEPSRLTICPKCKAIGTRGEGSLFWDSSAKIYKCFNSTCHAFGPSPDKLIKPSLALINSINRSKKT